MDRDARRWGKGERDIKRKPTLKHLFQPGSFVTGYVMLRRKILRLSVHARVPERFR